MMPAPKVRLRIACVNLEALRQRCKEESGVTHNFTVWTNKAGTRCTIEYSNPDEWGTPNPYRAVFPMARDSFLGAIVFLQCCADSGGGDDYAKEACFQAIDGTILAPLQAECRQRDGGAA